MIRARYVPLLLALIPAIALAQLPDSILVSVDGGTSYDCPSYGADFGVRLHDEVGPYDAVGTEPYHACEPLTNADDVSGDIAFVYSGVCPYTEKVQHAAAAGAEAVIVFNDDMSNPDTLVIMVGDCLPEVCSVPAVSISYNCGISLITEQPFGAQFTLVPIRVASPVVVEEAVPEWLLALGVPYPNPASMQTTLTLDVPTVQAVRLAVFDVLGREVAVLHDGPLAVGPHTLTLDASALSAGLYLVRATGAGHRATRKLVITR